MNSKIDKKRKDPTIGKRECFIYKIKYSGYDNYNNTFIWQLFMDIDNYSELIADFYNNFFSKFGFYDFFRTSEDWFLLNKVALPSE
jgi:hypothetical protein